jgi:serine/threonine-protein kinase
MQLAIPGFDRVEKVGEGPITEIWRARQVSLDRFVAIRLLKPHAGEDEREIFLSDARAAADLEHPNIVRIFDVRQEGDLCFMVMEYVGGPTVLDLLHSRGRIPVEEAMAIAERVAEALRFAWERCGIVHRNIKPASIRLDHDGAVKLTYLGISLRPPNAWRAPNGALIVEGTPHYMAPEQARGETFDFRADMYALGATLYHMLTGRMPFAECDAAEAMRSHIKGRLPNPAAIVSGLTAGVTSLLARLMMKVPADRFQSWDGAVDMMHGLSAGRIVFAAQRKGAGSTVARLGAPVISATRRRDKKPMKRVYLARKSS